MKQCLRICYFAGVEAEYGYRRSDLVAVVPAVTASIRVSVLGDVSNGDSRPRTRSLGSSQHYCVRSCRQRPCLFTCFRATHHCKFNSQHIIKKVCFNPRKVLYCAKLLKVLIHKMYPVQIACTLCENKGTRKVITTST